MSKLRYFKKKEFIYNDEEVYDRMDPKFLTLLDNIRHIANVPMKITSSWRPKLPNKPPSDHHEGKAVDVSSKDSYTRYRILYACFTFRVKRIGIGEDFIHIGAREDLPQLVAWDYYDKYKKKGEK